MTKFTGNMCPKTYLVTSLWNTFALVYESETCHIPVEEMFKY